MGSHFYFCVINLHHNFKIWKKMWVLRLQPLRTSALGVWGEVVRHLCKKKFAINAKAKVFLGALIKIWKACINLLQPDFFFTLNAAVHCSCGWNEHSFSDTYPHYATRLNLHHYFGKLFQSFFHTEIETTSCSDGKTPVCFWERSKACNRVCSP